MRDPLEGDFSRVAEKVLSALSAFFSKVFSSRGHHWALRSDREWLAVAQEGVRAGIFLGRNS